MEEKYEKLLREYGFEGNLREAYYSHFGDKRHPLLDLVGFVQWLEKEKGLSLDS